RIGALLGGFRRPDGARSVRLGGDKRAVQVDGARCADLGGQRPPGGRHAARGPEGRGRVSLERREVAGRDARVLADGPRLVGHHPEPEASVLEARLDPDGQQHTEVDAHEPPPMSSESPRMRTRTGWARAATAHSWPVVAVVETSLANLYPAGG